MAPVRSGSVRAAWAFPAEVRALARASLAAGADGPVEKVAVRVGDRFARGDLLLEVDRSLAAARLGIADARVGAARETLAQTEREAQRLVGLPSGVVAEQQREQADSRKTTAAAELAARRAERAEAAAELDRHRIRAPFDGVVSRRLVDRGDWVRVGDPSLEVVASGGVELIVDAGRTLLGKVSPGDAATVVSGNIPLTVAGVVPALDPSTRTLRIRLVTKGAPPPELVPGAAVEVRFEVALAEPGSVIVPQDALLFDGQRTRVVKNREGKAAAVEVEVLARAGDDVLVRSSELAEGEQVIVRGNERVRPGQAVVTEEA
ncbi:MAG: efflux RND transporter periplasmic adaptor subunit [Myxococcota bacterium]